MIVLPAKLADAIGDLGDGDDDDEAMIMMDFKIRACNCDSLAFERPEKGWPKSSG